MEAKEVVFRYIFFKAWFVVQYHQNSQYLFPFSLKNSNFTTKLEFKFISVGGPNYMYTTYIKRDTEKKLLAAAAGFFSKCCKNEKFPNVFIGI